MNDTLKAAGRIGAELGAAKAEVERLSHKLERARDHLTHARHDVEIRANAGNDAARLVLKGIDQWLSDYDQSSDDTFTAVDMATAAAQGFRDGQAAVEPSPAPDELEAPEVVAVLYKSGDVLTAEECGIALEVCAKVETPLMTVAQHNRIVASLTRPAQTEQQPVRLPQRKNLDGLLDPASKRAGMAYNEALEDVELLNTPPIAQTAPQHPDDAAVDRFAAAMKVKLAKSRAKGRGGWDDPNVCSVEFLAKLLVEHIGKGNTGTFEDVANFAMMLHQRGADPKVLAEAAQQPEQSGKFAIGDRVKKTSGSEWVGHVCGTYSTPLTPEGYAVESEAHAGSVQIYPAKALEAVDD